MGRGVEGVMKVTLFNDYRLWAETIFDLIIQGQVLDMIVQRNVTRFCTGSITLADQGL